MILDPVVHGVTGHKAHIRHGLAHAPLQHRIDVGQKQKLRVAISFGYLGLETRKHVQFGVMRLGFIQVIQIGAFPEEALARSALNPANVDVALVEDRLLLGAEVLANHGDDAHIGKKAGCQRKVGGCAAQAALLASRRGFNRIESHAAYYGDCHVCSSLICAS